MQYEHTQKAPLAALLYIVAAMMLASAVMLSGTGAAVALAISGGLLVVVGAMFGYLTVRDAGDHLAIRYGPIAAFRANFPYAQISDVARGRSALIDGWGVHWVPGRGVTYNLWGRDCVTFRLGERKRLIRVGTDDAERLTAFLRAKAR